jgi:6-pyruvoyltetrahydropterin/6-carboxytetrahydropterin synthase
MYSLKSEASFDSAHFLSNYNGKCKNIHGHRWKIVVEIVSEELIADGKEKGMVSDFSNLKRDIGKIADYFDHAFIYEIGSLKKSTVNALIDEGFRLVEVSFRPTAENFARYIFEAIKKKNYTVKCVTVYETPTNCASYSEN